MGPSGARSQFLMIPSVPFAHPVIPDVRPLRGTQTLLVINSFDEVSL
jgi:hypothetical protein